MNCPIALVKVLRAERADVPLGTDELAAVRADPLEPRAAGRAEDELLLHAFLAGRTHDTLLCFREQALLRELTLIRLTERLFRTNDEIKEEAEDVEDDHHETREIWKELVLGPLLSIANGPEHHREVDREDVQTRQPHRQLDERVADDRCPELIDIRHLARLPSVRCHDGPGPANNQVGL